jgi:hypothetical protein
VRDRSRDRIEDLGPVVPPTAEQADQIRQLVNDQPDADYLLDVIGINPIGGTS